ncbi:hypothetical protein B5P46_20000 [Rhizobium leguminosarum]|uniref:Uncharacterized protein n=1 Tax=Rhizobium leguminosarum TaxID=384 RepID=A0A4Q1U0L3_RHILE|nr:hypothetical protein B5P46_20000 [Rhizobium leguminosarum]
MCNGKRPSNGDDCQSLTFRRRSGWAMIGRSAVMEKWQLRWGKRLCAGWNDRGSNRQYVVYIPRRESRHSRGHRRRADDDVDRL